MKNQKTVISFPQEPRAGCKDIWNSYILENAHFDDYDIPFCPTTATCIPENLISIKNAKTLYEEEMRKGNSDFKYHAFIHPYVDDQIFDGSREGYWTKPHTLVSLASHFDGIITLDYSTCLDFPDPLKRWNTYRSRTLGIHTGNNGIPTINNVRWGEAETYGYSFSGLPKNSMYAIGTVASGINKHGYKEIFEEGLNYLTEKLEPQVLIIYGSDSHPVFDYLRKNGIKIITFKSETAKFYERRNKNE